MIISRLYVIVDAEVLRGRGVGLREFAEELRAVGVRLVQWRDKVGCPADVLAGAAVLRAVFAGTGCVLIMNDRADLAVLAGFDGVHVGQRDLLPEDARAVLSAREEREGRGGCAEGWVGISTHTEAQVQEAELSCADYVAIGPVFRTGTKADAEAVVGLEGVRRARALTTKPLVAIGGITRGNARSVIEAGADSVAVISALVGSEGETERLAREMMEAVGDDGFAMV